LSSTYEQLEEIVKLASQPLPERPDGIVAVAKYSKASPASGNGEDCRATEAEYERLARQNPATLFLRCFAEYENAAILIAQAQVVAWPTFDVFYGGAYLFEVHICVCFCLIACLSGPVAVLLYCKCSHRTNRSSSGMLCLWSG